MELKMKYHYSYFIYPYVIKEEKIKGYIQMLLKNNKCTLKTFEKRKNFSMYSYFLPTIRSFMFKSFDLSDNIRKIDSLGLSLKANILASNPCTIFEYNLGEDIQAKAEEERNIL